jgi:dipeptidyl aminopeptidase/acylaminoacyl peptidase
MKICKLIIIPAIFIAACINAQQPVIQISDNLVVEGIPPLPASMIDEVKAYTESRGAGLVSWHPLKREMLITTRFGNSNQIHNVEFPGGARTQLTFFDEPVRGAIYEPVKGSYFLFLKDIGGNEFTQIYRYNLSDKKITLLTDGKRSQNGEIIWSNKGERIAYASTERNGQDRDIFVMNPADPSSKKKVAENTGGGWGVADWSPDDNKLLVYNYLSINESKLFIVDLNSGIKSQLLPETDERSTFLPLGFSKDGKGIYLITNRNDEFNKLAFYDLSKKSLNVITSSIPWDVENADLSKDRKQIAFIANENGASILYILSTSDNSFRKAEGLPTGQIGAVEWSGDSKNLGLTINSYNSSSDVYEYDPSIKKVTRWTKSELGGMDVSNLQEPKLIKWKSFDGRNISGYLYKASSKFTGKRPVMISIHGGPEGQFRPVFPARLNYYLNELGISIICPNVRGSSGYGKTFVDLDNGMKREESVKDIGALLDWIVGQPDLDSDRILVTGGSYGGYMTLAVSYMYSDKIRCSLDVVGISNYNTFLKNTEAYRRDLRRVEYGDERDPKMAEFFEATAPANHTDKIKKPLFIVQGGNDPRVPYTESIQMKENIQKNGGTVWFLMAKDEGHGFAKKNNVDFQFYATIAFIKQFLLN